MAGKTEVAQRKGGRPTKFSDRMVERLLEMAKAGATDAEMAKAICVSRRTLQLWKGKHPEFMRALQEAKDVADEMVELSLYRRATGYSHPAIKIFCSGGEILTQKYVEHHPPDTTACIFWLKNRQPDRWRDQKNVALAVKSLNEQIVDALSEGDEDGAAELPQ